MLRHIEEYRRARLDGGSNRDSAQSAWRTFRMALRESDSPYAAEHAVVFDGIDWDDEGGIRDFMGHAADFYRVFESENIVVYQLGVYMRKTFGLAFQKKMIKRFELITSPEDVRAVKNVVANTVRFWKNFMRTESSGPQYPSALSDLSAHFTVPTGMFLSTLRDSNPDQSLRGLENGPMARPLRVLPAVSGTRKIQKISDLKALKDIPEMSIDERGYVNLNDLYYVELSTQYAALTAIQYVNTSPRIALDKSLYASPGSFFGSLGGCYLALHFDAFERKYRAEGVPLDWDVVKKYTPFEVCVKVASRNELGFVGDAEDLQLPTTDARAATGVLRLMLGKLAPEHIEQIPRVYGRQLTLLSVAERIVAAAFLTRGADEQARGAFLATMRMLRVDVATSRDAWGGDNDDDDTAAQELLGKLDDKRLLKALRKSVEREQPRDVAGKVVTVLKVAGALYVATKVWMLASVAVSSIETNRSWNYSRAAEGIGPLWMPHLVPSQPPLRGGDVVWTPPAQLATAPPVLWATPPWQRTIAPPSSPEFGEWVPSPEESTIAPTAPQGGRLMIAPRPSPSPTQVAVWSPQYLATSSVHTATNVFHETAEAIVLHPLSNDEMVDLLTTIDASQLASEKRIVAEFVQDNPDLVRRLTNAIEPSRETIAAPVLYAKKDVLAIAAYAENPAGAPPFSFTPELRALMEADIRAMASAMDLNTVRDAMALKRGTFSIHEAADALRAFAGKMAYADAARNSTEPGATRRVVAALVADIIDWRDHTTPAETAIDMFDRIVKDAGAGAGGPGWFDEAFPQDARATLVEDVQNMTRPIYENALGGIRDTLMNTTALVDLDLDLGPSLGPFFAQTEASVAKLQVWIEPGANVTGAELRKWHADEYIPSIRDAKRSIANETLRVANTLGPFSSLSFGEQDDGSITKLFDAVRATTADAEAAAGKQDELEMLRKMEASYNAATAAEEIVASKVEAAAATVDAAADVRGFFGGVFDTVSSYASPTAFFGGLRDDMAAAWDLVPNSLAGSAEWVASYMPTSIGDKLNQLAQALRDTASLSGLVSALGSFGQFFTDALAWIKWLWDSMPNVWAFLGALAGVVVAIATVFVGSVLAVKYLIIALASEALKAVRSTVRAALVPVFYSLSLLVLYTAGLTQPAVMAVIGIQLMCRLVTGYKGIESLVLSTSKTVMSSAMSLVFAAKSPPQASESALTPARRRAVTPAQRREGDGARGSASSREDVVRQLVREAIASEESRAGIVRASAPNQEDVVRQFVRDVIASEESRSGGVRASAPSRDAIRQLVRDAIASEESQAAIVRATNGGVNAAAPGRSIIWRAPGAIASSARAIGGRTWALVPSFGSSAPARQSVSFADDDSTAPGPRAPSLVYVMTLKNAARGALVRAYLLNARAASEEKEAIDAAGILRATGRIQVRPGVDAATLRYVNSTVRAAESFTLAVDTGAWGLTPPVGKTLLLTQATAVTSRFVAMLTAKTPGDVRRAYDAMRRTPLGAPKPEDRASICIRLSTDRLVVAAGIIVDGMG